MNEHVDPWPWESMHSAEEATWTKAQCGKKFWDVAISKSLRLEGRVNEETQYEMRLAGHPGAMITLTRASFIL